MGGNASMEQRLSLDVLKSRYKEAKHLTTGVVFGKGDGILGEQVRGDVICRNEARKAKANATEANNRENVRQLAAEVGEIQYEMKGLLFVMLNKHLQKLIR